MRENRENKWRLGGGEPTQDGAVGFGHPPTQANAGDRCAGGEQAASPCAVYGIIVDKCEATRTAAFVFSHRLWQPGEKVSITICAPFSYPSVQPNAVRYSSHL